MNKNFSNSRVALIANGPLSGERVIAKKLQGYDTYIAVDGGLDYCAKLNITPSILIGDLDSVNPDSRSRFPTIPTLTFKRDKDWTDLELALKWVWEGSPLSMTIFGGFGARMDHSLSNVLTLFRYPGKLFLETASERMGVIDGCTQLSTYPGQLISLIPLNGKVEGVTTRGLKWELDDATLDQSISGISNVARGSVVTLAALHGYLLFAIHDELARISHQLC